MRFRSSVVIAVGLVGQGMIPGEVSYEETTKITGGSVIGLMKFAGAFSKEARQFDQPIVTSISVKGNRMARVSQDSAEIVDLDAQTITRIDKVKHQYSILTFAQIKEAMEQQREKAKTEQAKNRQTTADPNIDLGFDAHVRKTGTTKQVSGIDTNEVILTLAMNGKDKTNGQQGALAVTNDMWMASELPGYSEIREFNRKLAAQMGSAVGSGPDLSRFVQQAAASDAMKTLSKEMADLQGVPVLQVMRMGITANGQPLPAASEAVLPGNNAAEKSAGETVGAEVAKTTADVAQQTAAQEAASRVRGALGSSLGSAIGGFGGFGRKKKAAPQDTAAPLPSSAPAGGGSSAASPSPASGVLVESVTEMGRMSPHVDPAVMEVPAGYQLVPAAERKRGQ